MNDKVPRKNTAEVNCGKESERFGMVKLMCTGKCQIRRANKDLIAGNYLWSRGGTSMSCRRNGVRYY